MSVAVKPVTTLLHPKTFLSMIRASRGSPMFRHLYACVDGKEQDLLRDGQVACAFYVSFFLSHPNFGLLPAAHSTVDGLEWRIGKTTGWRKSDWPTLPGEVIVWEESAQARGELHKHAGFYMGGFEAISHLDQARAPTSHDYTFDGRRKIAAVYTHPFFAGS